MAATAETVSSLVVKDAKSIKGVRVVKIDKKNDLAILEITSPDLANDPETSAGSDSQQMSQKLAIALMLFAILQLGIVVAILVLAEDFVLPSIGLAEKLVVLECGKMLKDGSKKLEYQVLMQSKEVLVAGK